jgi:hypothetical protein
MQRFAAVATSQSEIAPTALVSSGVGPSLWELSEEGKALAYPDLPLRTSACHAGHREIIAVLRQPSESHRLRRNVAPRSVVFV